MAAFVALDASAAAQDDTRIVLKHALPGITLDVYFGGPEVATGIDVGAIVDLTQFAGQSSDLLELRDASSGDLVDATANFDLLPPSGHWTLVAHLDSTGNTAITSFQDSSSQLGEGTGRIVVRHVAEAGPVDIVQGASRPIQALSSTQGAEMTLPAGTIDDLQLAPAGDDPSIDLPPIQLAAGTTVTVYVVGSLESQTFDVILDSELGQIPPGTIPPTTSLPATSPPATSQPVVVQDTTPVPGRVDTGMALSNSMDPTWFVATGGFALLAGTLLVTRRRVRRH
jgi:hypothetical protein